MHQDRLPGTDAGLAVQHLPGRDGVDHHGLRLRRTDPVRDPHQVGSVVNRNFQALTGELLVVKQGRGRDFLFTPTGLEVVERGRATFADWLQGIADSRRRLGSTLTVGTTEFTLGFLGRVWERVAPQLLEREIELKVVHVRARDFWKRLDSNQVDLLCDGLAADAAAEKVAPEYDFLEWHREGLALLTNLPARVLAARTVGIDRLRGLPLVIPSRGDHRLCRALVWPGLPLAAADRR